MLPPDVTAGFLPDPDNLDHLTLIDAQKVRDFVAALNAQNAAKMTSKKLVAAIGTGGTISMKVVDGIRVPDLNFDSILQQAGGILHDRFSVLGLDAFQIDSSQMDYRHVRDLAIVLTHVWKQCRVDLAGFLVLHGTDTMAYTAAAISLLTGQGLPFSVVFTGAQKSIQEPVNDAAANLQHSLFTIEALHNADMAEIVVVMGDHAMLGTSAVKVNDTLVNAFDAPLHKYVTTFEALEYPVRLAPWLRPRRPQAFEPTIWAQARYAHTLIVNSSLGLDPALIARQVADEAVQAVLLFSYGAGTVYEGVTEAIMKTAAVRNIPVFVVSPVNAEYKIAYESAQHLVEQGVVPLYMTLPTALAKIEIALRGHPGDTAAISAFMTNNYVGEIPGETSRFSPILER
jgi:L-asparaginase